MTNTLLSKKKIVPAAIFFGGLLIASGILISANLFNIESTVASQNPEWAQTAGTGISVPACESSAPSITCVDGAPSVTFNYDFTGWGGYKVSININDVFAPIADDLPIPSGSFVWNGAANNTFYNYTVRDWSCSATEFGCVPDGGLAHSYIGSFTTPNCAPPPITYTLSVNSSGASAVVISSSSGHGGTTNYAKTGLTSGTEAVLTAPAASGGNNFASWSGCSSVSGTTCTASITADRTVTATYTPPAPSITYTVAASISSGSGTITGPGISCPGDCSETYPDGTWITLVATPSSGYSFASWASGSGAICTGQGSTCSALINGDKTARVNFDIIPPPTVSLTADPNPVAYDTPSMLTWSSTNATSCTASGAWSGAKAISGSQTTGNMTVNQTFIIACTGPGGTDSDSVIVSVIAPPSFNYSLSNSGASSVTKTAGDAFTTNTITKTLTAGTTQSVTLSVSGQPAGVTSSISNQGCSPTCTSVITFTVSPSAPVGTYPITVTGSPLGRQTNFNLVISGSPFEVSCSASPSPALLGQTVTWTATVVGGIPPFTYSWSGTNIPTSPAPNTNPFSIVYSTIGQKTATVTVTDTDSVQASCPTGTVQISFDPDFEEF